MSVTIGLLGAIYGGRPIQSLKLTYGYEPVILGLIGVGILLACAAYFFIPEKKCEWIEGITSKSSASAFGSFADVLKNPQVIFMCIVAGLMVGPLEGFADVWGPHFLKLIHGFSEEGAASLPSFIFFGMALGGPVFCFWAEATQKQMHFVAGAAAGMAIAFVGFLIFYLEWMQASVVLSLVGVCCAYQVLMIQQISVSVPKNRSGIATAISNMMIMSFGYLFHSVIGKTVGVFSYLGDETAIKIGIATIPIALIAATLGLCGFLILKRIKTGEVPCHGS